MLRNKHVPIDAFTELRRLKPVRQIVAVELMVAINKYSTSYAKSIVAGTSDDQLVEQRIKTTCGSTEAQRALMDRESGDLDREFKLIEQTYGAEHLDLVLAIGYLTRLLGNARVVRYLAQALSEQLHRWLSLLV